MAVQEKISVHETIREMYERVHKADVTNVVDRFQAQELTRCPYCTQGISCSLCSNGPCRITKKADRGVCGIEANGMAMRSMLHRGVMGASAYTYHANEVAKTLKATAEGKTPFGIKDEGKLRHLAEKLGIDPGLETKELARAVADFMVEEINRDSDEPSKMAEIFAPARRKEIWRKLGIFPGGPAHEIMSATASAMTNIDSDYVSLTLKALRLGLSTIYGSQICLELVQDVLFGTPMPHEAQVDLGVLDPDYVNIVPNGHEPFVGAALIEAARAGEVQRMAREAGAKGLRIVGSIETGQELIQRIPVDDVFAGMTGNWISQEFALATGAVDVFVMDMNCSLPVLAQYGEKYGTTIVSVSKLVRVPGVQRHLDYQPELVRDQALEIVKMAVENYRRRHDRQTYVPGRKQKAIVGFSPDAVLAALGGSVEPLLSVIKDGSIKGVVALISCTALKNGGQDTVTVEIARELIGRDILVLSAGCGNAAVQVAGLTTREASELAGPGLRSVCDALKIPPILSFGTCTDTGRISLLVSAIANALGVDTADLPVAVTAPQYMEQKAVIDAFFAVAFGLYTHVSPVPPITGAPDAVKLLTQDAESIVGGKVTVETDPIEAVDGIEKHIMSKRALLGI
jgi:carbon-monoxide dehydrogenase catalytic subunit